MSKKGTEHSLFSNSMFILKFAFKTNKTIFLLRIPQIILNAARPFIPIIFVRLILNEITIGQDTRTLLLYALFFGVSTFAANMLGIVFDNLSNYQTQITVNKMRKQLGEIIMNMRYDEIENPQTRDFIALAQDGANFSGILDQIINIITSALTIAGVIIIIITIQPIIFLFVFLVVALRMLADKKSRKLWGKWQPLYAPIMRKVGYYFNIMQNVEYGKEVRINHLQDWIFNKVNNQAEVYLKASTKHNMELQRNNILVSVAAVVQEGVAYIILAYRVVFENMSIGDFSMYMTSINTFANGITGIVGSISELLKLGLFAKWFRKCAESTESVYMTPPKEQMLLSAENNMSIEFQNVSFKYPNTEKMILKNLSLKINSGESLSIVGANGAGKTTFVKLLCRFYEPTQGKILINGIDINTVSYDEYRDLLGVVFQDFKLFAFSVKENVSFNIGAEDNRVIKCIEESGLSDKISNLTNGLQTSVYKEFDSEGIEFSGGEGQKLAFARTLYKDAPIIILDEPTSALDPLAEYEIYCKFNQLTTNKTTIYISHRLSSCKISDKIAVFDDGEIIEYGTHQQLAELNGKYNYMWNMQAQYYV